MFTSIAGRAVVVTGGTRGIGKGIASVFARNGAKVLITGRDAEAARTAAEELHAQAQAAQAPGEVSYLLADVASREDCRRVAAIATERLGGVDVLCANAGIFPDARLEDLTEETSTRCSTSTSRARSASVQACLPALAESGHGRVILTSSITGPITGFPGWSHYGASKAGQLGFIRSAAIELARRRITVNAVLPGNIVTEGLASLGKDYEAEMTAAIPMGRLGTIDDIAYAALFLATDEASYITGQTIVVDGGQVLPESLDAMAAAGRGIAASARGSPRVVPPRGPDARGGPPRPGRADLLRAAARPGTGSAPSGSWPSSASAGPRCARRWRCSRRRHHPPGSRPGGGTFVARARSSATCPRIVGLPALLRSQGLLAGTQVLQRAAGRGGRPHRAGRCGPGRQPRPRPGADPARRRHPVVPGARQLPGPALPRAARAAARRLGLRAARGALRRRPAERSNVSRWSGLGRRGGLLDVEPGAPLLAITRTTTDPDGDPIEFSHDLFRADRTRIVVRTEGGGARAVEFPAGPGSSSCTPRGRVSTPRTAGGRPHPLHGPPAGQPRWLRRRGPRARHDRHALTARSGARAVIAGGRVVELDGVAEADFDSSTSSSPGTASTCRSPRRRWPSTTSARPPLRRPRRPPRTRSCGWRRDATPAKLARVLAMLRPGRADDGDDQAARPAHARATRRT